MQTALERSTEQYQVLSLSPPPLSSLTSLIDPVIYSLDISMTWQCLAWSLCSPQPALPCTRQGWNWSWPWVLLSSHYHTSTQVQRSERSHNPASQLCHTCCGARTTRVSHHIHELRSRSLWCRLWRWMCLMLWSSILGTWQLHSGITITLGRQRNIFWMQLSWADRQRFGWNKKNTNATGIVR